MKISKTHKIVIALIILGIIGFAIYNNRRSAQSSKDFVDYVHDKLESLGGSAELKKGTRAKEVTQLQNAYNDYARANGKSKILVDGIFGSQTQGAVKEITGRTSTTLDEFLLIIKSK